MNNTHGSYFVFEGPSGVGKTTFAKLVTEKLNQLGLKAEYISVVSVISADKHSLANFIFQLLQDPKKHKINSINSLSMYLLKIVKHVDIIERKIRSSLAKGYILILDRFWWSTHVFAKIGGFTESILKPMDEIYKAVIGSIKPNIIFNMQREISLKNKYANWDLFLKEYNCLANKEKLDSNVINIYNDKDISIVLNEIISYIMNNLNYIKKGMKH